MLVDGYWWLYGAVHHWRGLLQELYTHVGTCSRAAAQAGLKLATRTLLLLVPIFGGGPTSND